MKISKVSIKNYRSFDLAGQTISFPSAHCALVGKNNAGKSNIFNALDIVLGTKNPRYLKFEEEDFFDIHHPIEIQITISDFNQDDKPNLFSIPSLTLQQKGALNKKLMDGSAEITLLVRKSDKYLPIEEEGEETEITKDVFELKLWGFEVHKKIEDVRKSIIRMLIVPAIRDYKDDLSASKWTPYGQLMKEVLENSPNYDEIKDILSTLNIKIQEVFASEKKHLVSAARIVSYVEDISFKLTKENSPAELLRNLEIFIKENSRLFNIENVGTGTQSAIIIGILELVLKHKSARSRLFCIEEPEAYIHPHGIRYLGSLVKNISSGQNTQVLISTHSLSLTANFNPKEIIRVNKENGKTVVKQATHLDPTHFKRFIHQDNAELFFSDRVILVEGPTEKILFNDLDKATKQDLADPNSDDCNFDRINVGIIRMDSVDSIVNYLKITRAFEIEISAIVDKDFLSKTICKNVCAEFGISYQNTDEKKLISDLKSKNILVNTKGEIEDLFPDQDIVKISGRPIADIHNIKSMNPNKTSAALKVIFGSGKVEYAINIADFYIKNKLNHPFDRMIRNLYKNDISKVTFD